MTKEDAKHLEYVLSISNWCTFPRYNTPITMLQLYKRTRFNGNLSMKFCTCKKDNHEKKSSSLKFLIFFQVVNFILDV
jgi:hypothetical protein